MEHREEQHEQESVPGTGEGEDHREGQPGYDLDEQAAIEDLERQAGEGEPAERPEE